MLAGLYSAATGLEAAEQLHEVVSENLAHVSVPGYRAQLVSCQTFEQLMASAMEDPSPEGHGTLIAEFATDFTPGPTAHTGHALDVALGGDGFFELAGPDGPLFTRNGVFYVNSDQQLTNSEGLLVQGTSGPITLPDNVSTTEIHIASDGSVSAGAVAIGQLRTVRFADNSQLVRAGTTLFSAPPGMAAEAAEVPVMQGTRELSNVSAVSEMVRMIVGTRHYEAAQKALSTLDQSLGEITDPNA
jgi:flagellar basal body rod protein FlgG